MKTTRAVFALPILAVLLAAIPTLAQDHQNQDRDHQAQDQQDRNHQDNHVYKQHHEWRNGSRIQQDDWNRGDRVDYRQNHLRRPPSGHEWRQIDGHYVLASHDGVIVSIRQAPHSR